MTIRIKWEYGSWWAYFNGYPTSRFHADRLEDMCRAIEIAWPREKYRKSKET